MSYKIFVHADPDFNNIKHDLSRVADTTLSYLETPDGDLTLVLTNDEGIQDLNREFAGIDLPTDVLSFSDGETDIETNRIYYGDVILSIPYAERQARLVGNSLGDELTLLVIHGVLHLLGFDHSKENNHQKMWSIQDEILKQLGSGIVSPREL
jgi:probable rRNA maturation factor